VPFRARFDCLWCGQAWETRSQGDLEGWALLCPDCLGRADDNGFLRMRLRSALRERAASAAPPAPAPGGTATPGDAAAAPGGAATPAPTATPTSAIDPPGAAPGDWEDWYLRRGGYSRGPIHDGPWSMELEQATRWLDGLDLGGVIVELGAGMGWWSGLLAEKGELWLYEPDGDSLDAARTRLMAHGLLAHLHQRDLLAAPDKAVDVVFGAYLLSAAADARELTARLELARRWLKPGGRLVIVEALPDAAGPIRGPSGLLRGRSRRELRAAVLAAGFASADVDSTRTAFVLGEATTSA
jgi:SAM-dependent methyltransferase